MRAVGKALMLTLLAALVPALPNPTSADGDERREWRISPRKAKSQNPVPVDTHSLTRGEEIYLAECESCHGPTARGDGPEASDLEVLVPDLTIDATMAEPDGSLYWKVTIGRKPMPGYRKLLSKEERWDVVNFLRMVQSGALP